jgi:hypothetical protein
MSLALLYPLALLGALAVGVPLWLHLHRRFHGNVVRFSALRFLHDEPLARRAPLRLKHPVLFALRALAVLLLAAAFAWPYDRNDIAVPSLESRVYLLDNTLSHQADGALASRRERLADEIQGIEAGTQVAVVELATQPWVLVPFGQERAAAAEIVRTLEPTFERGSYAAAFRLADTLLRTAIGDRRRLFIYSDHQANQYEELLQSPPFLEGVEVESVEGDLEPRSNVALARPQMRRMLAGDRSLLELTLELYHQGSGESATLSVTANGKRVLHRALDLAEQPDRVVLTMRWEEPRGVAVRGEAVVEGESDALAGDDRVYFALPPVRRGRVALVARSIFLGAAFAPDVMQEAWEARTAEPTEAVAAARRGELADLLCLESHYFRDSTAAKVLLNQYLDAGRGVLLVVDDAGPEVADVLKEFGFTLDPQPVVAAKPEPAGYVQRDHPIFQPFRSPDFGNLTDVHFTRHFAVRSSDATPLLFTDAGDPLLFELSGHRKLLLATFAIDREATDWPLHPTFVPFLDLCLQSLRREQPAPTNLLPREVGVFHLPTESKAREFILSDGARELERGPIEGRRVQFAAPAKPGIYFVRFDSESDPSLWLAVNPPPLESELSYTDPAEVVAKIVQPEKPAEAVSQPTRTELTRAEILQQRLWWLILLVALLALFGENLWLAVRGTLR